MNEAEGGREIAYLLDAAHIAPDHRPTRNLVSTPFEFNGVRAAEAAVALMGRLLGTVHLAEEIPEAFTQWRATASGRRP